MKLRTKKMGRFWWIVGDEEDGPYGPYDIKAEADSDRIGVQKTIANVDDRSYFTSERERDDLLD